MKKAKVRVTGNYVNSRSFTNRIDSILNLRIDFTETDIAKNIPALEYAQGYSFDKIEILCMYDDLFKKQSIEK